MRRASATRKPRRSAKGVAAGEAAKTGKVEARAAERLAGEPGAVSDQAGPAPRARVVRRKSTPPPPPALPAPAAAPTALSQQPPAASLGLDILFVASEAQPFSKTGGLADVASALPRALGRMGHRVTVVTPRYRDVPSGVPAGRFAAVVADRWYEAEWQTVELGPNARAVLVDCPVLYARPGIYAEGQSDYPDNPARFAFLSIAALEWAARQPAPPDVLHGHDWQAGLLPVYRRRFGLEGVSAARPSALRDVPCVFTIHNVAYQGVVDKRWVPLLGLSWEDFTFLGFEFYDRLSLLKSGLMFSQALTTVSPTYADEIQRPEYGYGFDGILRSRADALVGILNGIDVDEWNPSADRHLPAPFSAADLAGKRAAKRALLEQFGLPSDESALARPVVGMVSRMVDQKGLDLIAAAAAELAGLEASFTIVGSGEARFEGMWRALSAAAPQTFGVFIGFDERRAHLVEAGADIFLMPSRFEPCGLNQMYSMRYGTVPVARAVGGLVDTVTPHQPGSEHGTGFLFSQYDPRAMMTALRQALDTYRQPDRWHRLQVNGMSRDFSWERSATEYLTVYKGVMGDPRRDR